MGKNKPIVLHMNPENTSEAAWKSQLFRLRSLWEIGIRTVLVVGRVFPIGVLIVLLYVLSKGIFS